MSRSYARPRPRILFPVGQRWRLLAAGLAGGLAVIGFSAGPLAALVSVAALVVALRWPPQPSDVLPTVALLGAVPLIVCGFYVEDPPLTLVMLAAASTGAGAAGAARLRRAVGGAPRHWALMPWAVAGLLAALVEQAQPVARALLLTVVVGGLAFALSRSAGRPRPIVVDGRPAGPALTLACAGAALTVLPTWSLAPTLGKTVLWLVLWLAGSGVVLVLALIIKSAARMPYERAGAVAIVALHVVAPFPALAGVPAASAALNGGAILALLMLTGLGFERALAPGKERRQRIAGAVSAPAAIYLLVSVLVSSLIA